MMVKLGSEDPDLNDLDRIQESFPTDNLLLYEKDPLSSRSKLLVRKRSTTASRLQRALSGKNKIVPTEKQGNNNELIRSESVQKFPQCPRNFIMDTPVQLTTGVQSQERHLFLFNDLLIVAKARASGTFKLKEKVRVAELWLSNCLEVVCEVTKNGDTSFVMGWPTTNVVATFCSTSTRDLWLAKLKHLLVEEQQRVPQTTSIRVHYWDPNTKEEFAHNVSVSPKDTVVDCINNAVQQLALNPVDANSNQLWVKTDRDSAPYPLIGHESPFAIKMNCLYAALSVASDDDLEYDRSFNTTCPVLKCYFILRSSHRGSFDLVPPKKSKRIRKSPILQKVFRRSLSKPESLDTTGTDAVPESCLFSQPLSRLVQDGCLPKSITEILQILFEKGPYTVGIFRKSANVRMCREIRDKLNATGGECDLENVNIFVLAALLKEFLRSLPDCLLLCCLYLEWLAVPRISSDSQKIQEIQRLLEKLPSSHLVFLRHFMCILWHVQRRESENMMSATNLAVCVGPSLLWPSDCTTPTSTEQSEASKQVPAVVEFLIKRCDKIFGKDCLSLYGNASKRDISRQDSGNEESDSLHSLQSSQSSGLRRDDSSIDSLEHALLSGEQSPKLPSKAKMSLTNLSRDSGLTMSDTQLYTPDEEMDSEASSNAEHRHAFQGTAVTGNVTLHRYRGDEWRASSAKQRSLSCSSAGGDSACSVDGRPYSQEGKRSTIGSPSCLSPSGRSSKMHLSSSSQLRVSSSCPPHRDSAAHHGNHLHRQQQSLHIQHMGNSRMNEMTPKSLFPLGDRKDVTKRRLSRSRAWSRPISAYGLEEASPEPVLLTMRKSASEESILSNYAAESYLNSKRSASQVNGKEPASLPVMKGSATLKPCIAKGRLVRQTYSLGFVERTGPGTSMLRSKSVIQFPLPDDDEGQEYMERSKSYGRIEANARSREGTPTQSRCNLGRTAAVHWRESHPAPHCETTNDFSYDSSTLSDNDSTPHISRSNSRGKDYGTCSTGSSSNNYSIYTDIYNERTRIAGKAPAPPTYEEVLVRQSGAMEAASPQPPSAFHCKARQIYEESVRIYNEQMESEMHHAAPVRIDTSDEEPEPPPLPPKSLAYKRLQNERLRTGSASRAGTEENQDWYSVVDPRRTCPSISAVPPSDAPNVSVICGKRVLTASQNIYDVPPWRPTARAGKSPNPAPTPSRGRSATLSTSKASWHRSKSQPPPEKRTQPVEPMYDCPRAVVKNAQNPIDRSATLSVSAGRSTGNFLSRNQQSCRHGATVGRTFRRDISWSVSQLKSLFTRHRENHQEIVYDNGKACGMASKNWTKGGDSKVPPPYRPPPRVEAKESLKPSKESKQPWTSTLKRYKQQSVTKCSSTESQGSTSGGEESYV